MESSDITTKARTADICLDENVNFDGLCLSAHVLAGLKAAGFTRPSPIQLKAIPLGRCGLDLIVQAKSGTGKTCVFSVIALENVLTASRGLQSLVLAPTREIAMQISEVIKSIGSEMPGLCCHTFIGGMPVMEDKEKLKKCHIAIGTPGRIKQLIEEHVLPTDSIRLFILDEADKLLEENFQDQINWIYSALPDNKQMLALSATYPEYLAQHLTAYMRNPTFVRLNINNLSLLGIRQYFSEVPFHPLPQVQFDEKVKKLKLLLSSVNFQQCLVFSNYQLRAQSLSEVLISEGWPATFISGSQEQEARLAAMEMLKKMHCRILISTDLTSRGIDVEHVNLVVNLDVPWDHETYLHRIGRAGRFGSYGAAVSLVASGKEAKNLADIAIACNTVIDKLPDPIPDDLAKSSGYVNIDSMVTTEKLITRDELDHTAVREHENQAKEISGNTVTKHELGAKDCSGESALVLESLAENSSENSATLADSRLTKNGNDIESSFAVKVDASSPNKITQGSDVQENHADVGIKTSSASQKNLVLENLHVENGVNSQQLTPESSPDFDHYHKAEQLQMTENVEDMQKLTGELQDIFSLVQEIKNIYVSNSSRSPSGEREPQPPAFRVRQSFASVCEEYKNFVNTEKDDTSNDDWLAHVVPMKNTPYKVPSEHIIDKLLNHIHEQHQRMLIGEFAYDGGENLDAQEAQDLDESAAENVEVEATKSPGLYSSNNRQAKHTKKIDFTSDGTKGKSVTKHRKSTNHHNKCRMGVGNMLEHLRDPNALSVHEPTPTPASDAQDRGHLDTEAIGELPEDDAMYRFEGDDPSLPDVVDFSEYDQSYLYFEKLNQDDNDQNHAFAGREYDNYYQDHDVQSHEYYNEKEGKEDKLEDYYVSKKYSANRSADPFKWVSCTDKDAKDVKSQTSNRQNRSSKKSEKARKKRISSVSSTQNSEREANTESTSVQTDRRTGRRTSYERRSSTSDVTGTNRSSHSSTRNNNFDWYNSGYPYVPYMYPYGYPMDPIQACTAAAQMHSVMAQYYKDLMKTMKRDQSLSWIYHYQRQYIKSMTKRK